MIEYQYRGLPHAHLVVRLDNAHDIDDPNEEDFFLRRFTELNKILRRRPRTPHRREVPGGGQKYSHATRPGVRLCHGGALF